MTDRVTTGRRRRLNRLAVLAATVVTAVGCSTSTRGTGQVGGAPAGAPPTDAVASAAEPVGDCSLYERGSDTRITARGGGTAECVRLAQDLAGGGSYWSQQHQEPSGKPTLVCAVHDGAITAWVYDSGGQYDGQQLCSSFLNSGWTEDTDAEASASRAAASSAAASASASQQAADQQAGDEAVSDLTDATSKLSDALSTLRSDRKQADADLAETRKDAQGGRGEDCYNAQEVVAYDAEQDVGYDVTQSMSYDVDRLREAIAAVRQGIGTVNDAVSTLQGEGLPAPAGADQAVSDARAAVRSMVASSNRNIDQGNADMVEAYRIANDLTTGPCAGDGPGAVPRGLTHLS